ncbi:MAG: hypothetical protein IIZ78_03470 [Clostridiales bacterium]|nr:hypothetical protein [Clostridiales bacterium]
MVSIEINKFFKWAGSGVTDSNVQQYLDAATANSFLGIAAVGNNSQLKGIAMHGMTIDFTKIGGGNLTSVANQNFGQFQLGTPTTTDTINLKPATGAYITISSATSTAGTGIHSGDITFGLTLSSKTNNTWSDGLMTNITTDTMITDRLAGLQSLTINAVAGNTTTALGTYDPDASTAQTIDINVYGNSAVSGSGQALGLVPASNATEASTSYYLSGAGTWQPVTSALDGALQTKTTSTATAVGVWSANSSDTATLIGTSNANGLGVSVTGDATNHTVTFDLTSDTITALGNANSSVQSVTESNGTVTVTKLTNGTSGTTTFGVVTDAQVDGTSVVSSGVANIVTMNANYDAADNKLATESDITSAIAGLDANTVATVTSANASTGTGTTFTFVGVKENDGVIEQGDGTSTFTVGDGTLKISGKDAAGTTNVTVNLFKANDTADKTFTFGPEFTLSSAGLVSIKTQTQASASNKIATMADIASLSGAMHYIGPMANDAAWPANPKKGDVYIATGDFDHGTAPNITHIETGDMIVFGDSGSYSVVQTNMSIGTGAGQVAPNTSALTNGEVVVATATGIETSSIANLMSDLTITDGTDSVTYDGSTARTIDIDSNHMDINNTGNNPKITTKNFSLTLNGTTINDNTDTTYSDPFAWQEITLSNNG